MDRETRIEWSWGTTKIHSNFVNMDNQLDKFKLLWNRIKYQNSYQSTFYLRANNKNKALEMMNTVFSNRKLPDSDWFRMTRDFCFYMVGFLIRIHTLGPRSIQKQHFWSILLNVLTGWPQPLAESDICLCVSPGSSLKPWSTPLVPIHPGWRYFQNEAAYSARYASDE